MRGSGWGVLQFGAPWLGQLFRVTQTQRRNIGLGWEGAFYLSYFVTISMLDNIHVEMRRGR